MKKHVFLCETNHDDHYQHLMEQYVLEYLRPLGFNKLYLEQNQKKVDVIIDDKDVAEESEWYRNETQLGRKNICEKTSGITANLLAYKMVHDFYNQGMHIQGFEGSTRRNLWEVFHKICDDLKDENSELLEVDLKELQGVRKARNQAIVKVFYDITSKNESVVTIAGQSHCEDFHQDLLKQNVPHRIKFISLGSNSLNIRDYDEGDETEMSVDYICDFIPSNAMLKAVDKGLSPQRMEDKAQEAAFISDPNVIKCHDLGHELLIPDQHHFDSCLGQIAQAIEA